jgi:hypothetical protein
MIWIFASVALFLAVVNEGFRKVLLWGAGGVALIVLIIALFASGDRAHAQTNCSGVSSAGCCQAVQVCDRNGYCHWVTICR